MRTRMTMRPTAREIDDEAALWAVRLEGRDPEAAPDPALQAWLDGDARRCGALLRAQAALSLLDRGRALPSPLPSTISRRHPLDGLSRRRVLAGAGGAAAAAAAVAAGVLVGSGKRYGTARGEIRRVPFDDGSVAAINTASKIDVAMSSDLRQVRLLRGEVWFEVAKDPRRPFVVEAGPVKVRAVGTAFSVRRRGDAVDVLVTEGVVESWWTGADGAPVRIAAGSGVKSVGPHAAPTAAPQEIERRLAWRSGQIALDGDSLAEAAEEFNRYNARRIVIEDPELAQARFVGLFRTNEPDSFAAAAAIALGAEVVRDGDTIRLERRRTL
ncbi:FecR domain-containing protein [Phenylobacterium sp. LjRoot225]|uniref:FecR family protein n=1 Tax=Phenylobacterium sp. LjRoot225 TaxID=3342285 RepID=UPI003ED15D66